MPQVLVQIRRLPLIGLILLVSGFLKAWDGSRSDETSHLPGEPPPRLISKRTEMAIAVAELAVATSDIVLRRRRFAGAVGSVLFAGGIALFSSLLAQGKQAQCHCFGSLRGGVINGTSIAWGAPI